MSGQRWGLGSLVAGLESKLDTILAEDSQASAKTRAAAEAAKKELAEKQAAERQRLQVDQGVSRNSSRGSRPNSRLQDRLAKAVKQRSESPKTSMDVPSRTGSPASQNTEAVTEKTTTITDSDVTVTPATTKDEETKAEDTTAEPAARPSTDGTPLSPPPASVVSEQPSSTTMAMSIPSILTPETTSETRQSLDSNPSRPSLDISVLNLDPNSERSAETLEAELSALQKTHEESLREHREEMHSNLERIDALQSKLTYLSQQLASSAKATAADSEVTPADKKLAEKDAQIAALMEEGQKLSKSEMKYMGIIKKMRPKAQETEKEMTMIKQRLAKAEKTAAEQTERAKRAEAAEKAAKEDMKIVGKIEKDLKLIEAEREEAKLTITELRRKLSDALSKAEDAEKRVQTGSLEAEKRVTASLKEDIDNLRIEKKLAEDRGKRELQEAKEEAKRERERANVLELELRGEIANLESKLEVLRSRSEEVTSSATGDSQAKLLRQIETLQTQYAVASENWQGIEGTLASRIAALEKDRDDTAKRESDIRRKARDINSKARKLEDELESINERARTLEQDLAERQTSAQKLQSRLAKAEQAAEEARADLEQEKKVLEADFQQKLEEEKAKWQAQYSNQQGEYLRAGTPSVSKRMDSTDASFNRRNLPRSISTDIPLSPMDRMLMDERRPSSARSKNMRNSEAGLPLRQDSSSSLFFVNGANISNAPSINFDNDEPFDNESPPPRTINDMISVSTAGAGPSVQLVERMSAAVRRLESEKATNKEEIERLSAQLDESRETVVTLMREIEEKRAQDEKVVKLEKELAEIDHKHKITLEMLGEETEKVMELEGDIKDLKKIYRDLVDQMQG